MPGEEVRLSSLMRAVLIRLNLFLFLSGAAGLIYEVIWARLFADILGSTALSMTLVFSVFLLSMALGAWIFGHVPIRGRAALALYGNLEIGIAIFGLFSSVALIYAKSWIAIHLSVAGVSWGALASNLLVTALLIGMPTLLMGGTLPVLLNAARSWADAEDAVTQLYGWNTLGAAFGTLAAGFFLIWMLGLTLTLVVAISLNLLVGFAARMSARSAPSETAGVPGSTEPSASPSSRESAPWLAVTFLSGFCVLGYEMLWGRVAKFLLGDRTIAIAALLFIFITALGLASLAVPIYMKRWGGIAPSRRLEPVAWVFLLAAILHLLLVPPAIASMKNQGLAILQQIPSEFARRILTIWLLILPPILVLGLAFPLIARGSKGIHALPGSTLGRLYLVNTVGAALGAIFASFVLCRWVGTAVGFLAFTGILIVPVIIHLLLRSGRRWSQAAALLAAGGFVFACLRFPVNMVVLRDDEKLVMANEDEYGVQVLTRTSHHTMRIRNNRLQLIYDLGHPQTTHAQQMAAHLTMLLAGECGDVLNIGTGYGITAGTFTLYPDVRTIETIEILPFIANHQDMFSPHHFNYLDDRRVTLRQGDGRHHLTTSQKSYDIISVNVLDPYLPGSSSLYTVEFWKTARDHLKPGGVYTQLLWGADGSLLVRGLQTVFPTVLYFPAYGDSAYNIVAFRDKVTEVDLRRHDSRRGPGAVREIQVIAPGDPSRVFEDLVSDAWRRGPHFDELARGSKGRLHTDDLPVLEYRWAHGAPGVSILDSPLVKE